MATLRTDEYLETIYKLEQDEHPVKIVSISSYLNLSPPAVHEMIKRLKKKNLINTQKGSVCLSKKGKTEALKVVRKHRLSERFLTDMLGLSWEEAHKEACKLEHALSDKVEKKLAKSLGDPKTCPHGHPIPDEKGKLSTQKTVKLDSLKTGNHAIIKSVNEEDSDILQYLSSLGLLPDVKIKIEEIAPFNGPLIIKVGKSKYALGRTIANKIEVQKTIK